MPAELKEAHKQLPTFTGESISSSSGEPSDSSSASLNSSSSSSLELSSSLSGLNSSPDALPAAIT
jgi:hypothetical protein